MNISNLLSELWQLGEWPPNCTVPLQSLLDEVECFPVLNNIKQWNMYSKLLSMAPGLLIAC